MAILRGTLIRKITAQTLRYARKYPQLVKPQRIKSRINIAKRAEHVEKIAQIIIKDKKMRNILREGWAKGKSTNLDEILSRHEKLSQKIAEYVTLKTGSKRRALSYLSRIEDRAGKSLSQKIDPHVEIVIKKTKMTPQERKDFIADIVHEQTTAVSLILQPIITAQHIIEENYS